MRLWLDDVRPAPEGWTWVKTAQEAIELLENQWPECEAISLDHDLGANPADGIYARGNSEECGCLVAQFIADKLSPMDLGPITVHSWNGVKARRMAHVLNDGGYDVFLTPYEVPEDLQ